MRLIEHQWVELTPLIDAACQMRDPDGQTYAQLGDALAMTEAAVRSAVQRMRQRHRELLREEIAQTVTRPEEIEEELVKWPPAYRSLPDTARVFTDWFIPEPSAVKLLPSHLAM